MGYLGANIWPTFANERGGGLKNTFFEGGQRHNEAAELLMAAGWIDWDAAAGAAS